ncbi:Intein/homing endonuclease [Streptomyces venezuelae]|uniref:LAGLIDADG family homing endonuclease n=1 Tax=Streptomyces gardneri TaxID=66892 RepID=UPI0007212927|nr:Intein/homing endonuclease [Streptomyces venezuelae]
MSALTPTNTPSFMDLKDPRYAYMYGFLQADGHLSQSTRDRGRLTVEINIRDIAILREFQLLTPYSSSITERVRATNFSEEHHSATWSLCALEARTLLNELGLPYGKKSTKIRPPRFNFSRRDYLRGVIDADGSVGYTGQGFPFVSLTTSSTAVGAYLCHYAKRITGAERQISRNARDGVYSILYLKEVAITLAEHLYYPGCLALERKMDAAASLSSWERPEGMRRTQSVRRWKDREDRILLAHGNAASAAEELGRTEQSCSLRLWRLKTGRVPMPPELPEIL